MLRLHLNLKPSPKTVDSISDNLTLQGLNNLEFPSLRARKVLSVLPDSQIWGFGLSAAGGVVAVAAVSVSVCVCPVCSCDCCCCCCCCSCRYSCGWIACCCESESVTWNGLFLGLDRGRRRFRWTSAVRVLCVATSSAGSPRRKSLMRTSSANLIFLELRGLVLQ